MTQTSVVIPTHNRAYAISQAIDSVLAQTCQDFEIIVVDDGSTDNTREVLSAYQDADRVRCIWQSNMGVSAARNTGIKAARGEYVAFLDDDDLWTPDKLRRQVQILMSNPEVGMIYTGFVRVKADRREARPANPRYRGKIFDYLLRGNFLCVSSVIVRRKVLEVVGVFDESLKRSEDWDLGLRIAKNYPVEVIPEEMVETRVFGDSTCRQARILDETLYVVLDKVYDDPNLPESARRLKKKAYGRRCLDYLTGYCAARKTGKVILMLLKGLMLAPGEVKLYHLVCLVKCQLKTVNYWLGNLFKPRRQGAETNI